MKIDCREFGGRCACGKTHDMTTKTVVIDPGCLKDAGSLMAEQGISGKLCALYDTNTYAATRDRHLCAHQEIVLDAQGLHPDEKAVAWVLERLNGEIEVIAAVGGGSIHDIARYCAYQKGIRFVSCPTCASVDGFCSSVAAMTWYGFKKTLTAVAPEMVIADTEIIRNAPAALVKSGIGDIIAKYTALADWQIAHMLTGEFFCQKIYDITRSAADAAMGCIDALPGGSPEAHGKVICALVMSGIAMQLMGNSRPASGAEHHISHLIEMEPAALKIAFPALHGEKAGVGSILVAREYERLAEIEDITPYLTDYRPVGEETLQSFFGTALTEAVLRENEHDCLAAVSKATVAEHWQHIRQTIAQIPPCQQLYQQLARLNAKRAVEDIGVAEQDTQTLLTFSPLVRNRLTLMRLRRMIKFD